MGPVGHRRPSPGGAEVQLGLAEQQGEKRAWSSDLPALPQQEAPTQVGACPIPSGGLGSRATWISKKKKCLFKILYINK